MYIKKNSEALALNEIVNFLNLEVLQEPIDSNLEIDNICPLSAPNPKGITFSKDKSPKLLLKSLNTNKVGAIIVDENFDVSKDKQLLKGLCLLKSAEPQRSIMKCCDLFFDHIASNGTISSSAQISPTATLGNNVQIDSNVVIKDGVKIGDNSIIMSNSVIYNDVIIGSDCLIHSNVSIREYCQIGNKVKIHNSSVIGACGFGFIAGEKGIEEVPQIGNVIIEDLVEVGALSSIDRATAGSTRIGYSVKIDNHVQIGHNVNIGAFTIICGQAGIAGSCNIGSQVVLGGDVKVKDHIEIADNCRFGGGTFINVNILKSGDYAGVPVVPVKVWLKNNLALRTIDEKLKKFNRMLKEKK